MNLTHDGRPFRMFCVIDEHTRDSANAQWDLLSIEGKNPPRPKPRRASKARNQGGFLRYLKNARLHAAFATGQFSSSCQAAQSTKARRRPDFTTFARAKSGESLTDLR